MSIEPESNGRPRRLDKWLWCARQFKTRSLAARFVAEENVRVTRAGATQRVDRPAFALHLGDEISYLTGERLIVLSVLGFSERRGSPEFARTLFSDRTKSAVTDEAPACKAAG